MPFPNEQFWSCLTDAALATKLKKNIFPYPIINRVEQVCNQQEGEMENEIVRSDKSFNS